MVLSEATTTVSDENISVAEFLSLNMSLQSVLILYTLVLYSWSSVQCI